MIPLVPSVVYSLLNRRIHEAIIQPNGIGIRINAAGYTGDL
jgi:hypothetical protein